MQKRTKDDLQDEISQLEPHPEVDYSKYDIAAGQHYVFDESDSTKVTGYRNYTAFVNELEQRGGIKKYLWATKAQIAGAQSGTKATGGLYGEAGDVPIQVPSYVKRCTYAQRWKSFVQLPAMLETLQAYEELPDGEQWVLNRIGEGHSYQDIAYALNMMPNTLIEWMMNHTDAARLKAAWALRTEHMLEQADQLFQDAVTGDFSTPNGAGKAEAQARVLSSVATHMKLQAVARHPNYQPKKVDLTVSPGSINIQFGAPD